MCICVLCFAFVYVIVRDCAPHICLCLSYCVVICVIMKLCVCVSMSDFVFVLVCEGPAGSGWT